VDSLRAEGVTLRLDLIEGVSRDEAIERTNLAHLAVDQLNIGWYGGYSVEAMSLGRPVLCHIREEEPGDNPWGDELPIIRTTAETLREDLRALICDSERMRRAASEGRSFVERRHDPRRIARQNLEGLVPIPK
jgi:Glycosyl transferases group 1